MKLTEKQKNRRFVKEAVCRFMKQEYRLYGKCDIAVVNRFAEMLTKKLQERGEEV